MRRLGFAATFALLSCLGASASAAPLTWTLDNVVFDDGGTVTGSFIYDADTNTYSGISLQTAGGPITGASGYQLTWLGGSTQPSFPYSRSAFGFTAADFSAMVARDVYDEFGMYQFTHHQYPQLKLRFVSGLTNAGGTVALVPGSQYDGNTTLTGIAGSAGFGCLGIPNPCLIVTDSVSPYMTRLVVSGTVTAATPVPVPSAALLLLGPLGLIQALRRRQRAARLP